MAKFVRFMWLPVLVSVLYAGWVVYQRRGGWQSGTPRAERDPMAAYGNRVKILHFYTSTPEIPRGGKALLCYGVVNAASVRLEPPSESVWPAMSRCFEAAPSTTTRYTLTAVGSDQANASESLEVVVKP